MPSNLPRLRALALLPALLAVSACGKQVVMRMPTPPAADVKDVTSPKPAIVGDIVNDDSAAAAHSAKIETWADTISAAGIRLCQWMKDNKAPVTCPQPAAPVRP